MIPDAELTPENDPEFWDRPSEEPPFLRPGAAEWVVHLWTEGPLSYLGPIAKNDETGTIYYYIRGRWTTTAPKEDEPL